MRLVGTVIRSRNVGRQMAVVGTWMEVRRLAFPVSVSFHSRSIFTPQPLGLRGIVVARVGGRAEGRKGRQAPLTLPRPQFFTDHFQIWQEHLLP